MQTIRFSRIRVLYCTALLLILGGTQNVRTATIGSDSACQRFAAQQILNNTDIIAGFAALDAGFKLVSYTVSATYNSFFPVSGNVALDGGTLVLHEDLYLENVNSFMSAGTINGFNHRLEISPLSTLPFPTSLLSSCGLTFITSVQPGTLAIETVDWSWDSQYLLAGSTATVSSTVLFVYHFDGQQLAARGTGSDGGLGLSAINSVDWHPAQYVFAVAQANSLGATSQLLTFSYVPATNTITTLSSVASFSQDATAVSWNSTGTALAVGTAGAFLQTPFLAVYNVNSSGVITSQAATINLTQPGIGTRFVEKGAISWDITNTFIAIGANTTTVGNEVAVAQLTPGTLTPESAATTGFNVLAVAWHPTIASLLVAGLNTTSGNGVQLYQHTAGALTQITAGSIPSIGAPVQSLAWNPNGTCLAVGWGVQSGIDTFDTYSFNSTTSQFSLVSTFSTITANGVQAVSWAPNGNYVAEADNTNVLSAYDLTSLVLTGTCSTLRNVNFTLNSDLTLQDICLKLSGVTTVNGRGNILTVGSGASIVIDTGASVLFENLVISGVSTGQLICLDNVGTMSFQNAQIILDGDFTFSTGRFDVFNQLLISGPGNSFIYTSTAQSIIWNNALLMLDANVTFSYQPTNGARNALLFVNNTAELTLNNAILAAGASGISLLTGKMVVDGSSSLFNQGQTSGTSMAFGDGTTASNDFIIRGQPAANLFMNKGFFQDNNI